MMKFNIFEKYVLSRLITFFCLLIIISGLSNASARQPTPTELEAIRKETKIVFQNFLQLWQEERYFELYEYGKRHSRNQLTIEEFELAWLNWTGFRWVCLQIKILKLITTTGHCFTLMLQYCFVIKALWICSSVNDNLFCYSRKKANGGLTCFR